MDEACETLDFSKKGLSKIEKASDEQAKSIVTLILDDNELQRLDNVETYVRIENLSVAKNELLRMYGVSRLLNLRCLTLNNNSILTIEGLKQLIYLKKLCLSGNNIKSIEHLNHNIHLEYLDLSNNQISFVSDISYLKHLKHLFLDRNRVTHLRQCERYLPGSLVSLGLARNNMCDLNEISHLAHLIHLENFNIEGNPCVCMSGQDKIGFDYRPFVINWLMSVKNIDGYAVNAIESLKAEWLYSQGRGRSFRPGEQTALISYLSTTCPLTADALETDEQRKLRLILSKAQHHQQQLRDQTTGSPPSKTRLQSPRMHARMAARAVKSPDRMSNSYHSSLSHKPNHFGHVIQVNQMSSSFSGELSSTHSRLNDSTASLSSESAFNQSCDSASSLFGPVKEEKANKISSRPSVTSHTNCDEDVTDRKEKDRKEVMNQTVTDWKPVNQPLEAASKMMPVPESLISPDYHGPTFIENHSTTAVNAESEKICIAESVIDDVIDNSAGDPGANKISKLNCHKVQGQSQVNRHISKGKQGSPKMTRSAMSSPKPKYKQEQRKGSFSTKHSHSQTENTTQKGSDNEMWANKHNTSNRRNVSTNVQAEIDVGPLETKGVTSSEEDNDIMCAEKLRVIKAVANERRQKRAVLDTNSSESNTTIGTRKIVTFTPQRAAVTIQKLWRGYRTRNLCQDTAKILHTIQNIRAKQYIEKLSTEMEATKAALESERKIQQLQMQAINVLWKKVSNIQGGSSARSSEMEMNCVRMTMANQNDLSSTTTEPLSQKGDTVKQLVDTCHVLQSQVQQLQGSMRDVLRYMSALVPTLPDNSKKDGVATQTEISAVHTPQGDFSSSWPFQKAASRPCSLPLSMQNSNASPPKPTNANNDSAMQSEASLQTTLDKSINCEIINDTKSAEKIDMDLHHDANSCEAVPHLNLAINIVDYNDDTSEGITMEERLNDGDISKCTDDDVHSACVSPGGEVTPVI